MVKSLQRTIFIVLLTGGALAFSFLIPADSSPVTGKNETQSQLVQKAQAALKQGNAEEAIQAYDTLLKSAPHSPEFLYGLGAAYYAAGRPRDAIEPLQEALKLKPGVAEARYILSASLAESDHCREALPDLKDASRHVTGLRLQRSIGMDGVRCTMKLDQEDAALDFLEDLRHRFPRDAEVLYLTVHVFSDLSTRASQKLLVTDPASYQVEELDAEALEAQGKWDEAATAYRKVLKISPGLPGIHYRLGRLILSGPKTPTMFEDAKKEFQAELAVDPHNAGAEFVLGEIALQSQDWTGAAADLSGAVKDDPTFVQAMVELGKTLISLRKPGEAVAPLESAVRLQPGNPAAHYLLATAYRDSGRREAASKQIAEYQKALAAMRKANQDITAGVTGRKTPAEIESQSQH
ncbi:MAG: tetratricopeptide repeat protein [Terriglobia bacterium]